MFRLIYRQRRRLLFALTLTTLALFMFLVTSTRQGLLPGWDAAGFPYLIVATIALTLLICGLIALACFSVWLWLFPNWRFLIEQVAMMTFIFTAINALWPSHTAIPIIGPFLPIIVFFAIFMTAYGSALDRFPIALGVHSKRRFISQKSAHTLWSELVPLPENKATHWDSLLHGLVTHPEIPNLQTVTYNHGTSIYQHQRQQFTDIDSPHSCCYRFDGEVSDSNRPITGGTYSITIDPDAPKGTVVTITETHDALLPRAAFHAWFDDSLGDVTDTLRARERGRRDWSLTNRYRRKVAALS